MKRLSNDTGTATVAVAGMIAVLLGLTGIMALAAGDLVDRHRAQVAADMAAMAGAYAHYHALDACQWVTQMATANGAQATGCELIGADVLTTVAVNGTEVSSRAGPAASQES